MVPTTAFTFPVLSWGPAAWHKVSAAPARGSGTAREAGGSNNMMWGELKEPGLLPQTPAKHLQQAGAGSLRALVEKQPIRKVRVRVSLSCTAALWGGGPQACRVEQHSVGGTPGPHGSPMQPPARDGTAHWGHWVTCPGCHGSSVAERESIGCVSLTPSPFPTSTKADLALGPKEMGLGYMSPLFLFWF